MILEGCKWASEVHILDKYYLELEDLESVNCDFIIHGDDMIYQADGTCSYDKFIKEDKFRICKRTTGISTTDVVYKLLNINVKDFEKTNEL